MTSPTPFTVGRRTAIGAAAWSVPVITVATAAPALAASAAGVLSQVDPAAAVFTLGGAPRSVQARLLDDTTPVAGQTVVFTLSSTAWATFPGGAATAAVVTDADGLATTSVVPRSGAGPALGTAVTVTASRQSSIVPWSVVDGRVDAVAPGPGAFHRLAISGSRVYSWGYDANGELGNDGTSHPSPVPVLTTNTPMDGKDIVAAAAGVEHSLAVDSDGAVYAWGRNNWGQLGNWDADGSTPFAVDTTSGSSLQGKQVTAIAGAYYHSAAVASDGTVHSWGYGGEGELGAAGSTYSGVPIAVVTSGASSIAGKAVTAIACGLFHTVALASDGSVHSWGMGRGGRLGDGTTTNRSIPVAVDATGASSLAGKTVTAIACGEEHTIALASDGTLHAWGVGDWGQLGNGAYDNSPTPVAVVTTGTSIESRTIIAVAAGGSHTVALADDGTVHTWGVGSEGQLGDGGGNGRVALAGAVTTAGTPMAGRFVTGIAAGANTTYATSSDRLGFAWGANRSAALGDGTPVDTQDPSYVPVQVAAVASV
ncbi:RCC1 domain-containing protein [Nocardioides plantarum]|uniref:RCC1 domain-containing protein n=1 Tax=Nocardioides plantarum TaxID=29299 RepID=A0ABV5K6D5_9ACTN|nr:hypothetical protein [Nocardioides plantarum]